MKWPWKKQEPTPIVDVALVAREAALVSQARLEAAVDEAVAPLVDAVRTFVSSPLPPVPDANQKGPYPLYAFDRPINYTTPQAPSRRPGSIVNIDTLRTLADTYDILRDCINHLKREVAAVPVEIVARDAKDDSEGTQKRIKAAAAAFARSGAVGGIGRRRSHFESEIIEDVSVVGACAIFHQGTRGGGIYESVAVDAATIRPRVDAFGWPGPTEVQYEQWIYGIQVAGFTRDQMTYDGIYPVSYSPYFKSPVEWLIRVVQAALAADGWNISWLTEGNTPSDLIALPDTWTPDQIMEFATWFDGLLSGNSAERQKSRFVPGGSQKVGNTSRKDQDFQEYELWLMRRTCAIMGVQPASIGFAGEQYKVSQEQSMDSTSAFGAGILLDFRKATYDDILERMGFSDLECKNVTSREEAAKERAERNKILVGAPTKTINEARQEEGKDAIEGGDVLLVPNTLIPLTQALAPPPEPAPAPAPGNDPAALGPTEANAEQQKTRLLLESLEAHLVRLERDASDPSKKKLPDILQVADDFRIALRNREDAAVSDMRAALNTAEASIEAKLADLVARMEQATAAGEAISPAWLNSEHRYRALLQQINESLADLSRTTAPQIADAQRGAAELAADQAGQLTLAALGETPSGVSFSWTTLPKSTIENLVGFASDGSPLRTLLDALGPDASQAVRDAMVSGVALGKNPRDIARDITAATDMTRNRALTIARTETQRAAREASRQSYLANADVVSGWIWMSAQDRRVCAACWAMSGTEHSNDETLDGHPSCRCVMVPRTLSWAEITGDDSIPDTRPEIPTGEEAFAALPADHQREVLGAGLYDLYGSGQATLADMVTQTSDPRWGTMRRPATLAEVEDRVGPQRAAALKQWERKALARLKARGMAQSPFQSAAIDTDLWTRIHAGLTECRTPDDVRALFQVSLARLPRLEGCAND